MFLLAILGKAYVKETYLNLVSDLQFRSQCGTLEEALIRINSNRSMFHSSLKLIARIATFWKLEVSQHYA
jgi:hypothetical protein